MTDSPPRLRVRVVMICIGAIIGFASNSLLARGALGAGLIDASSYALVRLASGAVFLWLLTRRRQSSPSGASWTAGAALAAYAAAFSFSYVRIGAALGALVLFPTVKLALLAWGVRQGERPSAPAWFGAALAVGGLAALSLPGAGKADLAGIGLMIFAGLSWAVYTVQGVRLQHPIRATAGNFVRATVLALPLIFLSISSGHAAAAGLLLAVVSGAFASGLVYCLWYLAVPELTAMQMGLAQMAVPVVAAFGAVTLLGEHLTFRLVLAGTVIFAGISFGFRSGKTCEPGQSQGDDCGSSQQDRQHRGPDA